MHFVEMKVKTQFTIQDTVLQVEKPIDISLFESFSSYVQSHTVYFFICTRVTREPFSCYSLL